MGVVCPIKNHRLRVVQSKSTELVSRNHPLEEDMLRSAQEAVNIYLNGDKSRVEGFPYFRP